MTHNQAESIVAHILGQPTHIQQLSQIHHPGTGEVYRISVTDPTQPQYLLKSYPLELRSASDAPTFWEIESANLANIEPVTSIHKPRYSGRYQNYFLQEYVQGELLEQILKSADTTPDQSLALLRTAVTELAAIHAAASQLHGRRRLPRPFQPSRLVRGLSKAIQRLEQVGFSAYEQRGLVVEPRWRQALAQFPHATVIAHLAVTDFYILGHGDYKPNNLIVTPDRQIVAIDWLGMGKAQPWYDLAYLLNSSSPSHKNILTDHYMQAMRSRQLLTDVTLDQAVRLANIGAIYQELVRAHSNVAFIKSRPDEHHVAEFTAALNNLAALVLDD